MRVTFRDNNATVSDGIIVREGTVNGTPIETDDGKYVPVWTERDNGREPTTVYVHESNILEYVS